MMRTVLLLLLAVPALAQQPPAPPPPPPPHSHDMHERTPRPAEKPGGLTKTVERWAYFAAEGETMHFEEPTSIRFEGRTGGGPHFVRTFNAGDSAPCIESTFTGPGVRNGYAEYVCTRLVETITLRELEPQASGLPYVDPRLDIPPKRGFTRAILGPDIVAIVPRPTAGSGEFRISCNVSHMGFEDPMVRPGREFWHHHTFVGNPLVNRYSVDMRDYDEGLCAGGNINRSGYWFPSVIDTRFGQPVVPDGAVIYYKGAPDTLPSPNLRMITGDPMRTTPRPTNIFPVSTWVCIPPGQPGITQGLRDEIPAACPVGAVILWQLAFPRCWDGVNDDSADHKSHVWNAALIDQARAQGKTILPNGCLSTHPHRLFDLSINVQWTVKPGDAVSRWRLSSDAYEWSKPAGYSAHADWWNGWDMDFLAAVKAGCHDLRANCHANVAPDGRRMGVR